MSMSMLLTQRLFGSESNRRKPKTQLMTNNVSEHEAWFQKSVKINFKKYNFDSNVFSFSYQRLKNETIISKKIMETKEEVFAFLRRP